MFLDILEGVRRMKSIKKLFEKIRKFCISYPAFLSGFFIYSYLSLCIIQYFIKAKSFTIHIYDIIESFDAFPFMWFLSLTLVKIIDVRTKLLESEAQRLKVEQDIEIHQAQLKTLHEVTRGLQHHINNPLAIIKLALDPSRKAAENNPKVLHQLDVIDESVNRISAAMEEFAKAHEYTVESAGPIVGDLISTKINT
jgi:signal transduction histidine kinase